MTCLMHPHVRARFCRAFCDDSCHALKRSGNAPPQRSSDTGGQRLHCSSLHTQLIRPERVVFSVLSIPPRPISASPCTASRRARPACPTSHGSTLPKGAVCQKEDATMSTSVRRNRRSLGADIAAGNATPKAIILSVLLFFMTAFGAAPRACASSTVGSFEIDGNLVDDSGPGEPIDWLSTPFPAALTTFT